MSNGSVVTFRPYTLHLEMLAKLSPILARSLSHSVNFKHPVIDINSYLLIQNESISKQPYGTACV